MPNSGFALLLYLSIAFFSSPVANTRVLTEVEIDQLSFPRDRFGNSKVSFWYPLTPFEEHALLGAPKAKNGDPKALFALAIFASGTVRDIETFWSFEASIDSFVHRVRPLIDSKSSPSEKGRALFSEMCESFLGLRNEKKTDNYSFDESAVAEIFKSGKYNCVSSAILFVILGRHFGLEMYGVQIPSHVFAMIRTQGKNEIEIETTLENGFDVEHDKAFFDRQSRSWFRSRGLPRSTHQDYLSRSILTPYELVCQNMINQHTAPDRLKALDRHRLYEARGYLMPESRSCVSSMLQVYVSEFTYLLNSQDTTTMVRFADEIAPNISCIANHHKDDKDILELLEPTQLSLKYASLLKSVDSDFSYPFELVKKQKATGTPVSLLKFQAVLAVCSPYLVQMTETGEFTRAVALLDSLSALGEYDYLLDSRYLFAYTSWMHRLWREEKWKQVLKVSRLALSYAEPQNQRDNVLTNIDGAYSNYANTFIQRHDYDSALVILESCLNESDSYRMCKDTHDKLKKFIELRK